MGAELTNRRGLLSVDETAQYLGVSPGTLRNWASTRRVEFVKIGRLMKFTQTTLDRYNRRQHGSGPR
jgi:excisionase family DNA binding protein